MFGAMPFIFVVIFVAVVIIATVSGFVHMSKVDSTRNRIFNVAQSNVEESYNVSRQEEQSGSDIWTCSRCGAHNNGSGICSFCGNKR